MSDAVRTLGDSTGPDKKAEERVERERRGATSSGGPSGRLNGSSHRKNRGSSKFKYTQMVEETFQVLGV
jgi:hypothetical protein